MNHLIFSAVLTACLGIGGHQHSHQHGPYKKPPDEYFYKEPVQLNSSETYSWPTLVLPRSTQHIAIYSFVFYMLMYFASNFGQFNVHAKVFRWMMMVYPILTALTGFQVSNLVPYLDKILPHFMGLYNSTWRQGEVWRYQGSPGTSVRRVELSSVNSLPPLALDHTIFPRHTKKGPKMLAKPLHFLEDLAHTVDERFVLAYPADPLPLVAPSWEETLVNLDYLLAWCRLLLKTIRASQSKVATSTLNNSSELQMPGTSSSQSDGTAEIRVKLSSPPGPAQ
ncbi:hypothetical protein DSO57_1008752 [Entomophthora muscae]|uniref:Uncharacterized protein n=1 Tax=Entomophthora muscae TaxID=34485 RepID=A0ACC2THS8_9FUNG|nr:hypothetical protein DSO57_1008752 [Entomophthora muscae]